MRWGRWCSLLTGAALLVLGLVLLVRAAVRDEASGANLVLVGLGVLGLLNAWYLRCEARRRDLPG